MAENTKIEWAHHTFNPIVAIPFAQAGDAHDIAVAGGLIAFGLIISGCLALGDLIKEKP